MCLDQCTKHKETVSWSSWNRLPQRCPGNSRTVASEQCSCTVALHRYIPYVVESHTLMYMWQLVSSCSWGSESYNGLCAFFWKSYKSKTKTPSYFSVKCLFSFVLFVGSSWTHTAFVLNTTGQVSSSYSIDRKFLPAPCLRIRQLFSTVWTWLVNVTVCHCFNGTKW